MSDSMLAEKLIPLAAKLVAVKKSKLRRSGFLLNADQEEDLTAAALATIGEINYGPHIKNPEAYTSVAIRNAIDDQLDFICLFNRQTITESRLEELARDDRENGRTPPVDFGAADELLREFRQSCGPLQQSILDSRWLNGDYADAIASDLGMATDEVVSELEQLQRQFLKWANARRRSRNNPAFPALRPQPITRVERPEVPTITMQELAAKIDARKRRKDQPAVVYQFPVPTRLAEVA